MGKSCIRFKKLDDLALELIGEAIRRVSVKSYIQHYESAIRTKNKTASKAASPKKASGRAAKPGKPQTKTATRSKASSRASKTSKRRSAGV